MNLADMLCYADIQDLGRIARHYACECSLHSKNELIQTILATVNRRDVLERTVGALEDEDRQFLNSLLFDPKDAYSLEELLAKAGNAFPSAPGAKRTENEAATNPRDLIVRFKQRGWLFHGFSNQSKMVYRVPQDLKKRVADVLFNQYQGRLEPLSEPPYGYRDEQGLLSHDMLVFLRMLAEGEMPLNLEGFLYKKHLLRVLQNLSVQEEPVGKTAWRFGYGRRFKHYPLRFSFLYDYVYSHGYIEEQPGWLKLTPQGEARLADGTEEPADAFYHFWLKLYQQAVPNLKMVAYWAIRLTEEWVTAESLGQVLMGLIKPFYYDSPQSIYTEKVVPMLLHLGLIRIGLDDGQRQAVQRTSLGQVVLDNGPTATARKAAKTTAGKGLNP